ncbi:MAG: TonB-dependent receptor domain-containing protein [Opitutaceae bacterium]
MTVYSDRVANQSPVATFAMPVTALRFEPRVDIQARNLAEGQADVTIRGGIFENTGFQLGALTVSDPQTGHYFAELPVAPALLASPDVRTGPALALGASNATVGAIHHRWRPIRTAGAASVGVGEYDLRRAEIYQGFSTTENRNGGRFGVDLALARSESDGTIEFGEHEFERANLRLQYTDARSQTDLFAGYQGKRFGWPNMYTPFNSNETENLQTTLFALNHHVEFSRGEFLEVGAFHRRNKDDYAFNRFAALPSVHPFQHTTWLNGIAASARRDFRAIALNLRAEILADEITSSSLTFGRFKSRTLTKFAVVPEKSWTALDGARTRLKAGIAHEDTNRDGGTLSPVFEISREFPSAGLRHISFSYTRTSQVPTYTALNSSATAGLFRGNPNLGREKAHSLELGGGGMIGGWNMEGAAFWRRDDSLVDWTFVRNVTARTASAVDIDVGGVELVARRSWRAVDLVIGYTGLTKNADYRGAPVDASFYALNFARHRITAAATMRLGHGVEVRMDNVIRFQAPNLLRVTGGDDAVTTALGISFRPPSWRGVEFALQADNLWDSEFQEVPAVPAARRQVAAGVSYAW